MYITQNKIFPNNLNKFILSDENDRKSKKEIGEKIDEQLSHIIERLKILAYNETILVEKFLTVNNFFSDNDGSILFINLINSYKHYVFRAFERHLKTELLDEDLT